ncbi:MAG: HD domain-containing protein [Bacteroidales bacterium]|nr:HD domain-containing protein [Bacteroidales bacterium]
MMETINTLEVAKYIEELFIEKIPANMTYHNLVHTEHVVNQAKIIGKKSGLNDEETGLVVTAAWFHDIGFIMTYEGHEEESKKIAQQYLSSHGIRQESIYRILKCIDSTRMPQDPGDDILSKVLCDADMSYIAENFYIDRTMLLWNEWNNIADRDLSKYDYLKDTIEMFENHNFHTEYGKKMLTPGKERNYKCLLEMLEKTEKKASEKLKKLETENKKLLDKLDKEKLPGRGVESMFRLTARNQINLSSIADNKANILITINSIVITLLLSVGTVRIVDYPQFILPAVLFVLTCVITIIFAILSVRPKISSGKFTKEDIHNQKVNLLFFGNFYKMDFEEYLWAVREMIKDDEYLYSNMIRDQYSLGKVISHKYYLLRIAYTIFMFGLILSILLFTIVLIFV